MGVFILFFVLIGGAIDNRAKGIYAYPQGEQENDELVQKSAANVAKVILQSLVRLVLGI